MSIIEFLSAFGLGALVTALIQAWLNHKSYISKRNFNEKKECYVGYLDALHKSEVEKSEKSASYVGHWQNRIELVGSKTVINACMRITKTNPYSNGVHPDRPQALQNLKEAMRKDLGVN